MVHNLPGRKANTINHPAGASGVSLADDPGFDGDVDTDDSDSDVTLSVVSSDEELAGDSELESSARVGSGSPASEQETPASETPEASQAREEESLLDRIDESYEEYDWNLTTDEELMARLKAN